MITSLYGRLPQEAFATIVSGYCDQLRKLGSTTGHPLRSAVAVPIPYRLGGSTSYYLVLVTRSPKAVTLFSDAADRAISRAWAAREDQERAARRPPAGFVPLFNDLPDPVESTYESRRATLLATLRKDASNYLARARWPTPVRLLHEALAVRHCGLFQTKHLNAILRDLQEVGVVTISPTPITQRSLVTYVHGSMRAG